MQLVSFSCEAKTAPTINGINLQAVNLFVGRNGGGKTQTLYRIELLAEIISEKRRVAWAGTWQAKFLSEVGILTYTFSREEHQDSILQEVLELNGTKLIERDQNGCSVFSEKLEKLEYFTPPDDKLVIHVRRDKQNYPQFERIIEWATNSYIFRFGTILPFPFTRQRFMSMANFSPLNVDSESGENLVTIYKQLDYNHQEKILTLMNKMGYNLTSIQVLQETDKPDLLVIGEQKLSYKYADSLLSQGTFRILVLLSYFFYLIDKIKPQLLLIDDLGEGLDYNRAYDLGKFIFDACMKEGVQLIATSNDSFLMNAVPIEYWNVLRRDGSEIIALNEKNSPKLFDDFGYSGLSNFDFLSSDYIESHQE